jgi:outer membrane lipoprotein-sorting protein
MSGMRAPVPKTALRWAAPAAFVLVIGGTGLIASTATAEPHLPPTTPEQLLVDIQNAKVDHLSGTVEEEANLGIPAIPGAGTDSSDFNSLVSGSHRFGVWHAAPDKARVALYGKLGESDLITNGTDRWTWSSKDNKVTHSTVPADATDKARERESGSKPTDLPKTPQEAAQRILKDIGPTTKVTTDSAVTVAGRPSYELVVRPNEAGSLVTEARLAVDGATHLPLRVEVFAGSTKVFNVGFTKIDFAKPDDKYFNFTPPAGAEVTEVTPEAKTPSKKSSSTKPKETDANGPTVVGTGWTTVVITKVSPTKASGNPTGRPSRSSDQLEQILRQLPQVSGDWGSGRLLAGTAFSAVLTDDGRLAAGSVTPKVLYAALKK